MLLACVVAVAIRDFELGESSWGPGERSSNGREIQMPGKFLHLGTLVYTISRENSLQGPCQTKEFCLVNYF